MHLNPYLLFDGQCEAAFKFYAQALHGKIESIFKHSDAPPEMKTAPEWKDKVMHARFVVGDQVLLGFRCASEPLLQATGLFCFLQSEGRRGRQSRLQRTFTGRGNQNAVWQNLLVTWLRHVCGSLRYSLDDQLRVANLFPEFSVYDFKRDGAALISFIAFHAFAAPASCRSRLARSHFPASAPAS